MEILKSGIPKSYLSTDGTMAANSDVKVPTEKAIVTYVAATAAPATAIDATDIADGSVTNTEFQYIGTLASNAQTQINDAVTAVSSAATINPGHHHIVSAIDTTGTADALIGTYTPAVAALTDGMEVILVSAFANATTTPTFQYNALTAKTIVKGAGTALVAGDIPEAGYSCHFRYRAATDKWVLLNPAITVKSVGTAAGTVAAGDDARFKYVINAMHLNENPADGATRYLGQIPYTSNVDTIFKGMIPVSGTLVYATIAYAVTGTLAEAGDYKTTVYFRYAAADTLLDDQVLLNGASYTSTKTGLSVAVTAGQTFHIKIVYPTWPTTNPTNVSLYVQLVITPSGS